MVGWLSPLAQFHWSSKICWFWSIMWFSLFLFPHNIADKLFYWQSWLITFFNSLLMDMTCSYTCAFATQVGVAGLSQTRRSCWRSASDWSRTPSTAPCNSTNRKHFRMGAVLMLPQWSPLEIQRKLLQRRTLQPTPSQWTGSDLTRSRRRDWKTSSPDTISQAWLDMRRVSKTWAQSLNQPTSQPALLTS